MELSYNDHSRASAGLTYVYPVLSRRAGGVSIGINLNTNNACNWRCVYCQVPDLIHGRATDIDFTLLESELRVFLEDVVHGDFYQRAGLPPNKQQICDIALSGNGEPTSSLEFAAVIELLKTIVEQFPTLSDINWILITNGSLFYRDYVKQGLASLAKVKARIWFKIDSVLREDQQRINKVIYPQAYLYQRLQIASHFCPVWIQTCLFAMDGLVPSAAARHAYLDFLASLSAHNIHIAGVLLYGLARTSQQPEASRLSPLVAEEFTQWAEEIRKLGFSVVVTP